MRTPTENINIIRAHLDDDEVLTQLAEEAAELAQAALKLRRAITGKNPTPINEGYALQGLLGEIADVNACVACASFSNKDYGVMLDLRDYKLERWATRLEDANQCK